MKQTITFAKPTQKLSNEAEVETFAQIQLKKAGFVITLRSCKSDKLRLRTR